MDNRPFLGIRPVNRSGGLALMVIMALVISANASIFVPLLVDISRDLNSSVAVVAQLSSITTFIWAALAPVMGSLSDRFGRKPAVAGGLLIIGITGIGCAQTSDYATLFVFRLLMGVGAAAASPVGAAIVGDLYPLNGRARAMGIMYAGIILGLVIAVPALAFEAQLLGWRTSFLTLGIISILVAIALALLCPPLKSKEHTDLRANLIATAKLPSVRALLSANFIQESCYALILTFLPTYLILTYGLSLSQVSPIVAVLALGGLVGNLIGGPLADRGWQLRLVCFTPIVFGLLALPVFIAQPGTIVTAAVGTLAIFFWGLNRPAYTSLAAELTPEARGAMMGLNSTTNQFGDTVGPALGGLLLVVSGYSMIGFAAAALGIFASLVAQIYLRPQLLAIVEKRKIS